ncbi:hypothetical protein P153DRAFT_371223 [Dothidotthia symphoricarpi CBS 119687]|uniref:Uncharacterized protein n=1 Tax=Dothidotthia symphoricarpi CBS 119687 TaxID=1392245 RepID=A0A6A5ZYD8_9PLEO|nr:hypothetical protein P153DRAFT_371223 [Dothidotthia symphoricarpi CBS 119687]
MTAPSSSGPISATLDPIGSSVPHFCSGKKHKVQKLQKDIHTTAGIHFWSPTKLLIRRYVA